MKTKSTSNLGKLSRSLSRLSIAAVCLSLGSAWTAHAQNDLFASVNGNAQNGGGFIYQYAPDGTPKTFVPNLNSPSGLDHPRGMVFDSSGNLFVTDHTRDPNSDNFQGSILKITPDGTAIPFPTNPAFPANFSLAGLVTDGAGNLFVEAQNANFSTTTTYKVTPDGTLITFGSVPGQGFGLAFDSAGNLYAASSLDNGNGTTSNAIYMFTSAGVRSIFADSTKFSSSGGPFGGPGPVGLAFDGLGNLFVSIADGAPGDGEILKFAPDGTETTFATGLSSGPRGLAFDTVGNLFVAEVPFETTGDILEFTPVTGAPPTKTLFASGIGQLQGNGGAEFLAFPPEAVTPVTPVGSNVMVNSGTVGSANIALTFSQVTSAGTTTVTSIANPSPTPSASEFELGTSPLAFDITTTATYTTPIIIAFQVPSSLDVKTLTVLHWNGTAWVDVTAPNPPWAPNTTTNTVYASVSSLSPFVIAKLRFRAQVQQPINADGTSVFSVKRGVVPVVFTLTYDGVATCQLPSAKISVIRTAGTVTGSIDENTSLSSADKGSNFRISNCQYVYNLATSSLGTGTYKVNILIGGSVVGSGTFALK